MLERLLIKRNKPTPTAERRMLNSTDDEEYEISIYRSEPLAGIELPTINSEKYGKDKPLSKFNRYDRFLALALGDEIRFYNQSQAVDGSAILADEEIFEEVNNWRIEMVELEGQVGRQVMHMGNITLEKGVKRKRHMLPDNFKFLYTTVGDVGSLVFHRLDLYYNATT